MFLSFKNIEITPTLLIYLGFEQSGYTPKNRRYKEFYFPGTNYGLKINWPLNNFFPKEWEVCKVDYEGNEISLRHVNTLFELNNIYMGFTDKHLADNNNFEYCNWEERNKRKDKQNKLNIIDQFNREGLIGEYLENHCI